MRTDKMLAVAAQCFYKDWDDRRETNLLDLVRGNISEHISTWDIVWTGLQGLILLWVLLCVAVMLIQFSYLSGRLYERLSGVITAWVLLLSVWIVSRLGQFAEPAFRWLPDFGFK